MAEMIFMTVECASAHQSKKILRQSKINQRIWELDAFRGLCILCVIVIHAVFDLRNFLHMHISTPAVYDFIQSNGGILFILLSGICVTLGSKSVRRGLFVLACGFLITAVTYTMTQLDPASKGLLIQFGILHLLGCCMILYPLYKRFPVWLTALCGLAALAAGYYLETLTTDNPYLFICNRTTPDFSSGDFFPLLPNIGWFMLGTVIGKLLYGQKASLFPKVPSHAAPIRFLSFCGRHSLWIYLLHQPILYAIMLLLNRFL